MTLGEKIRYFREKKGLSQEDLAKELSTTKQAIYKYESGIVTNIPIPKLEAIAEILEVKPWELLGWEPPHSEYSHGSLQNGVVICRAGREESISLSEEQLDVFDAFFEAYKKKNQD